MILIWFYYVYPLSIPVSPVNLIPKYSLPFIPGLAFSLLRDGYRNISNIDISPSVISQMNRMQQTMKSKSADGPISSSRGVSESQADVDCTYSILQYITFMITIILSSLCPLNL